ncbi:MAG: TetR family transcriptional regulator C-terminal domain-containing protein [Propionibacterium sp.]|nr:TetR family transcriptional regulator C-terminal domain-containing protein [Propionibacterium sp.]
MAHLTEEIMRETAWHVLIAELAAGVATNPALRELYRDIDENHRSTFAALLTSTGLVDTEQKARVAVRSLLAAVHGFALELTVDREAVSRDDIARTLQAIATTHVTHHVNTSSR